MSSGRKILILAVLIIGGIFWYSRHRAASVARPAAKSTAAPAFSITDLNGQTIDSAKLRGKVVLVDFWATWCTPCEAEIPHLSDWQKQYAEQGLQVLGISMDDTLPPVKAYVQQRNVSYPIAMANEKTIAAFGGVLGLPGGNRRRALERFS